MNQELIKFAEEKIKDNVQLQTFISKARAVANVVFPETLPFNNPYTRLGCEVVTVDPENEKHVYKNESGQLTLHLQKINEIAKAAKIRVVDSRILERKSDETGKVVFISHQIKVQYRTIYGEDIVEAYTGKYDYYRDHDKYNSEKQIKQRRSHAEGLAESNAMWRAFNKVLPQLESSFTKEQLKKPFLIPYVEDDKDAALRDLPAEDQIILKRERARKSLGLAQEIYPAPQSSAAEAAAVEEAVYTETATATIPAELSPEEINRINAETFLDAPQKERTEKILALIKIKGFKSNGNPITPARIEKGEVKDQVKFIEKLLNLPDDESEGLPV